MSRYRDATVKVEERESLGHRITTRVLCIEGRGGPEGGYGLCLISGMNSGMPDRHPVITLNARDEDGDVCVLRQLDVNVLLSLRLEIDTVLRMTGLDLDKVNSRYVDKTTGETETFEASMPASSAMPEASSSESKEPEPTGLIKTDFDAYIHVMNANFIEETICAIRERVLEVSKEERRVLCETWRSYQKIFERLLLHSGPDRQRIGWRLGGIAQLRRTIEAIDKFSKDHGTE